MTQFTADADLDILFRPRGGAENGKVAYVIAKAGEKFQLADAAGEPLNDDELDQRFIEDMESKIPGLAKAK